MVKEGTEPRSDSLEADLSSLMVLGRFENYFIIHVDSVFSIAAERIVVSLLLTWLLWLELKYAYAKITLHACTHMKHRCISIETGVADITHELIFPS